MIASEISLMPIAARDAYRRIGNVALRYGEDAFGCDDAVAFDDDGAVVQRCVLEEDIFEKRRRDFGIDGDTAFG